MQERNMVDKVPLKENVFKKDLKGEALLANKCRACGQVLFPKAINCLNCSGEELDEITLSRKGNLYT